MPNLADGVPLFRDDEYLAKLVDVTATVVGTLPLPSRTLGIWAVTADVWPVAADLVRVFAFVDEHDRLAAWMLRVDDASPVRWLDIGFGEDSCSIGDAGSQLEVIDGGWPRGVDLGFARNEAGAPLVCVTGPDLTRHVAPSASMQTVG